jgi:hypothetical protein
VPRFDTFSLAGSPLEIFSYHRDDRFPRSAQQPDVGSRRLYAAGRMPSTQAPDMLIAMLGSSLAFDLV